MKPGVCLHAGISIALVGILSAGCDVSIKDGDVSFDLVSGKAVDESTRTYSIAPEGTIEIENRNGSIEVTSAEGPQLEVVISRQAEARSDEAAQALLKQIEIQEEAGPSRVRLATTAPGDSSTRVNYTVRAPKSLSTLLKTENGRVVVTGMAGLVQAAGSNGPVVGKGLTGEVRANTINGPVRVELTSVGGDVSLATVNGPVHLALPATAKAHLSARSLNGRVVTSGLTLEGLDQKSNREMDARLNGGGPRVRLETTNGPIFIANSSDRGDVEK
ncbi:MAG TPA: hypothetical protein VH701_17445 [Vicinamibacterales bacterium]|jgi:DUF4097 and DUF4098 domain-containing protein YvlB